LLIVNGLQSGRRVGGGKWEVADLVLRTVVKTKCALRFTKHHAVKAYVEVDV
jgi:hypothetical protein